MAGTVLPVRIGVLASGSGTLLEAMADAGLPVAVAAVDRPCRATEVAGRHGTPAEVVARSSFGEDFDRVAYTDEVAAMLQRHEVQLVAMAGFALAAALRLDAGRHGTAFQSRLGRTPWIQPHTDKVLPELAAAGCRRLAVLCPAFVADCLETLEEIGIRAREQWQAAGGEALHLVPSLNAHPAWVETLARWIASRA